MESSIKLKTGTYIKIFALIIAIIVFVINAILTLRLKKNYSEKVAYNAEKGFRCEQHDDYYITTSEPGFFSQGLSMAVELDDVYYSSENETITIILSIEIDKLGNRTYMISFDDFDDGKEDFGGYLYVDENMNALPQKESNITDSDLVKNNRENISKLVNIANDRWNLNLVSQSNTPQ